MLRNILPLLLLATPCAADVVFPGYTTGLGNSAVYVLFSDGSDTAVQMTEGASLKAGTYTASDSAISTASLAAGTYSATIRLGDYSSPSASDVVVGIVDRFVFDGTNEVDQLANALAAAAAVQDKLPAGGKVIAAAGDSVTDLDEVNSGGTSAPFLNRKPNATVKVSTRADGYLTSNRVRVLPGETYVVALEYPDPNNWLFAMTLPVSPDTDQLTVDSDAYGVNRNLAMVEVTLAADATVGSTITLPVSVQPEQGTTDKRKVLFEVIDPDQ